VVVVSSFRIMPLIKILHFLEHERNLFMRRRNEKHEFIQDIVF
jgi:hypothetical protein